jgi:hypothetical protein
VGVRALWLSGIAVLAAGALATSAQGGDGRQGPSRAAVPSDFHGVVAQQPLTGADVSRMRSAGVGAVRFPISWQATEPRPGVFNWANADAYVRAIGEAGAEPLPFLSVKPDWLPTDSTGDPMSTPEARAGWAEFTRAAAERYGPGGSFSAAEPDVPPILTWQLWNEPNLRPFWGADPSPSSYATLAGIGSGAIREVDPGASIMLAGLAPAHRGLKPWMFLARTLPGMSAGTFDVAAIHPYGARMRDVREQMVLARSAMADAGFGGKPLAVTEIGWGSQHSSVPTTSGSLKSQADNLRSVYSTFASRSAWRVSQAFWFSWRDAAAEVDSCGFCASSGLLRTGGRPKPALRAFADSVRVLGP